MRYGYKKLTRQELEKKHDNLIKAHILAMRRIAELQDIIDDQTNLLGRKDEAIRRYIGYEQYIEM
jgi:DNA replicative helicase MCM subunit Mcm2 (Cdc46/Mcm family)